MQQGVHAAGTNEEGQARTKRSQQEALTTFLAAALSRLPNSSMGRSTR